jgi:DNA-binding Lrp family transcriptional regulator
MEFQAIFSKTPRGISEVKNRAARLPRNLLSVLALIDGRSTLERLLRESKLSEMKFRQAIERLEEEGFIKACGAGVEGE